MKELLKSVHICQSYRKNKSGTFFMAHGVYVVSRNIRYMPTDIRLGSMWDEASNDSGVVDDIFWLICTPGYKQSHYLQEGQTAGASQDPCNERQVAMKAHASRRHIGHKTFL